MEGKSRGEWKGKKMQMIRWKEREYERKKMQGSDRGGSEGEEKKKTHTHNLYSAII